MLDSQICTQTSGFMQNALPVLHYASRLPSLRNANQPKLMESTHVDGNLPQAGYEIFELLQMLLMQRERKTERAFGDRWRRDREDKGGGGHERVK